MNVCFHSPREPGAVLMSTDPSEADGAVWATSLTATRALGAFGVEVTLASLAPVSVAAREAVAALPNARLFVHEPPASGAAVRRRVAAEWLRAIERQVRPDVVHLNHPVLGAAPFDAPALVMGHDAAVARATTPGGPVSAAWRAGLRAAALVVVPAAALLTELERHFGPLAGARVVPYALEAHALPPHQDEDRADDPPVFTLRDPRARSGLAALEAAVDGAALVLADCPWWREAWGDAATWVSDAAEGALDRAARTLEADPPRRRALAARARERAAVASPRRLAVGLLAAYRAVSLGAADAAQP